MRQLYTLLAIIFLQIPGISQIQTEALKSFSARLRIQQEAISAETRRIADSLGVPLKLESEGRFMELERFVNGIPRYRITDNIVAAASVSTSPLWQGGSTGLNLSGNGVLMGIWDGGGVRTTHQEFGGRVTVADGSSSTSSHATHVAGTLVASGVVANAKGMSPAATLWSNDWNNDIAEMADQAADGVVISNHSYSYLTGWHYNYFGGNLWVWFGDTTLSREIDFGFGAYDETSAWWDYTAYMAPEYLIVKSSSNDRGTGPVMQPVLHYLWNGGTQVLSSTVRQIDGGYDGYDCIPWQGVAKNILTIGNVADIPGGYQSPADVVLLSSSSTGPADDGRIKPDLVGNGSGLYSTYSGSDTDYASLTGTSMSSPNVAGSAGLLAEHWRNLHSGDNARSATLKGLMIHTASEAGPNPGPDYRFGWGLLNTSKAALLMSEDATNGLNFNIRELTLAQDEIITIPVYTKGTEPLLATICWTDFPSYVYGQVVNDRTPMLINDLDLRLINSQGTEYLPWKLNPDQPASAAVQADNVVDNVEKAEAGTPQPQETWYVQISHKGTISYGPQHFTLVISGIETAPQQATWTGAEDSDWNNPLNWDSGVPSVNTSVTIPGNATHMPVIGSAAFAGNLTLNDGASILGNHLLSISGQSTVEREITNNSYHYVSSPVQSAAAGSVFPLSAYLRYYDETQPETQWINIYQNNIMQPGRGYALQIPDAGVSTTATFTGVFNNGPFTQNNLTYTANSVPAYDGYNLAGNPYPSPIDLESSGVVRTHLDATAYFWDPALNGGAGAYATYTIGAGGTNGGSRYVPVAQGFFVKVSEAQTLGSLTLNNDARTHESRPFYKSLSAEMLRITVSGDVFSDETLIRFVPETTPAFDGQYDAWKLQNYEVNQLYTRGENDIQLALNSFAGEQQMPVVPVNYRVSDAGVFEMKAEGTETFPASLPIVLLDLKMNYRQDLRQNNKYVFSAGEGDDENRFAIAFGTLSAGDAETADFSVFSEAKTIHIQHNSKERVDFSLYDLNGRLIMEMQLQGNKAHTVKTSCNTGMYIVKLQSAAGIYTTKVFLR
ncbi:MAG: S8 family serine peptidase [Lentimicrobium sp.]|nr:S8 family serine peptidase [Lentimicrobium sp.]